jgi:hypothetical protein
MRQTQGQGPLEGFPAATRTTFTGTTTDVDGLEANLGQDVEITMRGVVVMVGTEVVGDAGETRSVVKIRASTVTVR